MRVVKVLNNSLVLALNQEEEEVVIMGKGIGFNTRVGETLAADNIEKIYVLKDRDTKRNLIRLSAKTDSLYFELSSQIIDYAKNVHKLVLKDYIYLSLTDHIAFVTKRIESGYAFQNIYTFDMQRLNPKEYDVARYGLNLLREAIDINIPDSEIGYIAMHFIYQQDLIEKRVDYTLLNQIVDNMLNIVKYQLQIDYDKDSIVYARFLTHLSLFAQRIVFNEMIPHKDQDYLYEQLAANCTRELVVIDAIDQYLEESLQLQLSNQEKLYLLIHVHKLYDEHCLNH